MSEQVIWIRIGETAFAGLCDECLVHAEKGNALWYRVAKVAGTLRAEADVGFTRCDRGHAIRVRRLVRDAA
jgi:hypothetical protein